MTTDTRPVVFCTASNRIIDVVRRGESNAVAIARLAEYGTALTVLPLGEAGARYERQFISAPVEINAATFHEMLGVLPPVGWRRDAEAESFKISELTAGTVTAIYARIGDRYFHLSDSIFTPPADIIARIRASEVFRASRKSAPEAER